MRVTLILGTKANWSAKTRSCEKKVTQINQTNPHHVLRYSVDFNNDA